MSRGQAIATGTLAQTPVSQLLVYALDKRLTGTFVLQTPDGQRSALYLEQGVAVKAKTAEPVIYLGRLLLELGTIDEATYNRTLAQVANDRRLHGELLVQAGLIDHAALEIALAEQLVRQIVWMFSLAPETAYGFYEENYLERWGAEGAVIEPLAAVWRGIRSYETPERIEAALVRLGTRPVKLHHSAQIARFRFAAADQPILDVIRARAQPLADLAACGVGDPLMVKRIVYALLITRHLDVGGAPLGIGGPIEGDARVTTRRALGRMERITDAARAAVPAAARAAAASPRAEASSPLAAPPPSSSFHSAPPSAPPAPIAAAQRSSPRAAISAPPPSTPTLESSLDAARAASSPIPAPPPESVPPGGEFRAELVERMQNAPGQNYYEILGVDPDVPSAAISAAFFQLAKRFHPDRIGHDYDALRSDVHTLFSRMSEAHQTLTDADKRKEYDELLRDGGGTTGEQEEVQKVMRAVVVHQKATVLFRKQNFAEAEKLALEAMEADPLQQDYTALYVTVIAHKPGTTPKQLQDLLTRIDQALAKEPENQNVHFARAELLKKMGRLDEAVKDYKWVADRNPRNLEATREVRLYVTRNPDKPLPGRKSVAPPADKGGLLGKFFKR